MSSVAFWYGNWEFWERYPNQKVVFDGPNKIIYVNDEVTELDVKVDIYSAWKEWVLNSPEYPYASVWPEAISAIGGEPLTDVLNVGSTFFLENGWRIQPYSSKTPYVLTVVGNIYTREAGGNPFLFAEGASVNLTRSNLIEQVVAKAALSASDLAAIAQYVWEKNTSGSVANSYGRLVNDIDIERVNKGLTKGEFLALK
jgi:hypothetical protein